MSMTYLQGKDEIFGVANTAFGVAAIAQALAYTPKLIFPGMLSVPPDIQQIYGECSFSVVTEHQVSLSNVNGVKIYETVALFAMRLFSPKQDAAAFRIAETIGTAVKNAFRLPSPSGEIWFRNQRLSQVNGTETKNQINVVVTCTYKTQQ
jgi:hypothetical protein